MTLTRVARWLALSLAACAAWIGLSAPAHAVPVFARQTGHNCQACHTSPPELTAYGREFKLNGYTFGEAQPFPVAIGVMASIEGVKDNVDHSTPNAQVCPNCGEAHIDQASIYFGGRITENLGLFGQWTFKPENGGTGPWTSGEDNTDVRYVHRFSSTGSGEDDTVVGLDINNNLTMEDAWNTAPTWQYPGWFANSQSGFGPVASPITYSVLGQRAIGIGAYIWWKKTIYAQISNYQKPWGTFSSLVNGSGNNQCPGNVSPGGGVPAGTCAPSDVLVHLNPYARVNYSHDWDYYSFMVGAYALQAHTYFDAAYWTPLATEQSFGFLTAGNATSTYKDYAIDSQFQFNRNEPWIYTIAGSLTHESSEISPLFVNHMSSNSGNTLTQFTIRGTTYYDRKYGGSLSFTHLTGSADPLLYGQGNAGMSGNGSPASTYFDLELDYVPLQNMKFLLHYTAYTKLNGGSGNFDGLGNSASGQNTIVAGIWWDY